MPAIEVGRICVKTRGREAGRKCVIVSILDDKFVIVTGPMEVSGIKRRRSNIKHLEPTEFKINIKTGASDSEVMEALTKSNLLEIMKQKVKIKLP
ncbi:MAG: 50S ribosomal protein L14e [Candidatus Methanomethylicia archaeon]|nr:50S ribosomal protein L14e [Candidatus Methanomethylicia archaeon]MCX8168968.1 50S ribosomal protein L14e [Candidatus Methanomethylicia archaeon]MDW7988700.1 50S ribosomal protein L14e [Nitrososphaerota archaeon]